ncbi:MAG TPA: hypothetical protein PLJ78_13160 [Anaerolineae bacterium]|nr:hypothetical protein [Anaerolineae bacterium]HQK14879.1 hypothetical protein [Anaerolineae bacterium]
MDPRILELAHKIGTFLSKRPQTWRIARLWDEAEAAGVTVSASGNRSVAIGGSVSGSVIVTGDKNEIKR